MHQDSLASNEPQQIEHSLQKLLSGLSDVVLPQIEDLNIADISTDSRHVGLGDLFIAMPGTRMDGQDYIVEAIKQGASAVVYQAPLKKAVASALQQLNLACVLVAVTDVKDALGQIAARFYCHPSQQLQVIGITGTNGKTSCSHFIAQAFSLLQDRVGVVGTLGCGVYPHLQFNQHTTPDVVQLQKQLALFREDGVSKVAMEVSSHALDQGRVLGTAFDMAIFTQLSRDHLDYHGDMHNYAAAKEKLFQWPHLKNAIINYDDEFGRQLLSRYQAQLNIYTYSLQDSAPHPQHIYAKNIQATGYGYAVDVITPWGEGRFTTRLLARYNIANLLVLLAALGHYQINFPEALRVLEQITTVNGRMQMFGDHHQPKVVIDYAHTPDALQKSLAAIREHCQAQIWCVFGCGGDRDRGKRAEMGRIAENLSHRIVITNDNPRFESPEQILADILSGLAQPDHAIIELDRAKAIGYAIKHAAPDDVILVAGKGHETYQIINGRRYFLNDREQVEYFLNQYAG